MLDNYPEVVAVTVTFNRSETLAKTIECLLNQNHELEKIIIVDNNSSSEHLKKVKEIVNLSEKIELIELKENTGGAGGFEHGLRYAYEKYPTNWYWIMDDDAYPTVNCLDVLLSKSNSLSNVGVICPIIFGIGLKKYQLYHHKKLTKYLNKDIQIKNDIKDVNEIEEIESNAFVGPLISRVAIEKVGYPDGGLFIYGDDTDYIYRVSKYMKCYLVKDAKMNHEDIIVSTGGYDFKNWWKEYYIYRNRLIFVAQHSEKKINRLIGSSLIIFGVVKNITNTILHKKYNGYKKIKANLLFNAVIDGITKKRGKIIDPMKYNQMIKKVTSNRTLN